MNILFVTLGTAGDVYPLIALGKALQQRGHKATLVTIEYFEEVIREAGLEYIKVMDPALVKILALNPDIWNPRKGAQFMIRNFYMPAVSEVFDIIERHAGPDTVLVSTTLAFGARIAQEYFGIPLVTVHLQPFFFMSTVGSAFGDILNLPKWLPHSIKSFITICIFALFEQSCLKGINKFRAKHGLPHANHLLTNWIHSPQMVLGLFPEWFGPQVPYWPPVTRLTGFVRYDRSDKVALSDDVRKFLEIGDPPVVFTPGTAMFHGGDFFTAAVEFFKLTGRRAILLTSHPDHIPHPLPKEVSHFNYIPFSLLLPHAAALVHHGGIGSAAQALAAGVPQLIMPLNYDQPDNAARLVALGVATCLSPTEFIGPLVAHALEGLLTSDDVARQCRRLSEKVDFDQSLDMACTAIEEMETYIT